MSERIAHPKIKAEIVGNQDGAGFWTAAIRYQLPDGAWFVVYHKFRADPLPSVITQPVDTGDGTTETM